MGGPFLRVLCARVGTTGFSDECLDSTEPKSSLNASAKYEVAQTAAIRGLGLSRYPLKPKKRLEWATRPSSLPYLRNQRRVLLVSHLTHFRGVLRYHALLVRFSLKG
jgi:hypothetical protein